MTLVVTLTHKKDTKNKAVYAEADTTNAEPALGSLYITKGAAAALGNPVTLTVTLEAA